MQKAVEGWGLDFERLYGGEPPDVPVQSQQLCARRAFPQQVLFQAKTANASNCMLRRVRGKQGRAIAAGMQLHVE